MPMPRRGSLAIADGAQPPRLPAPRNLMRQRTGLIQESEITLLA
jgi:hypothetical protein